VGGPALFGRAPRNWSGLRAIFASKGDRNYFLHPKRRSDSPSPKIGTPYARCSLRAQEQEGWGSGRRRRVVYGEIKPTQPGLIWAKPPSTRREAPVT
jgi:hypothetical protein